MIVNLFKLVFIVVISLVSLVVDVVNADLICEDVNGVSVQKTFEAAVKIVIDIVCSVFVSSME